MKRIEIGQSLSILANLGVLAGIVFVALEIRQSNRIAVGTTSYELNRNWMELNELYMTNPDLLSLMVELGDENFVPGNAQQRELAEAYARRLLNNWFSIEEAYDNGIASDALYLTAAEDVRAVIEKRPGVISVFEVVAAQYDLSNYDLLAPIEAALEQR